MQTLSDQLRDAIRNSGLSILAVAKISGVPESVLNRFMRGERDLRLQTAEKVAAAFRMRLTKPKRVKVEG